MLEMDEKTALANSINQLVVGCTPYIRDVQSVQEVQNDYLRMEENNKDFHKYVFVKTLRSDIDKVLGPLIEAEIERYGDEHTYSTAKHENLVANITSRVLNSSEYGGMSENIRNKVSGACNYILENFHKEVFASGNEMTASERAVAKGFSRPDRHCGGEQMYSDAESSIGDTSLNHSTVIFMSADQQKQVAHNLERQNDIDTRKEAVRELLQVTSFDIQNCAVWPVICTGLIDALGDDNEDLCLQSLRFTARGLSANSACSREMYVLLVDFLDSQWKSQRPSCFVAKDGLDIAQPYVKKLLRTFRLLNSYQQLVPHYWQRYPDGSLDKILKPTVSLLAKYCACLNPTTSSITPLHFLALVDCKAKWFVNTMHGHSSRAPLLQILEAEDYRNFVNNAVLSCLNFVSLSVTSARRVSHYAGTPDRSRVLYSEHEVKFVHFLHCLCIIHRLIIYEQGRKFFPIKYNGKESVSLTKLLEALLQFVTRDSQICHHRCLSDDEFNPCLLITDMMKTLCTSEDVCHKTVCKDQLIHVLIAPIKQWLEKAKGVVGGTHKSSDAVLAHVAEILSSIASKRCGQRVLLYGEDSNWQSPVRPSSMPVYVLAEFAQKALSNDTLPRRVVGSLVFVCRQLYTTCEGLLQLSNHRLHYSLTDAWKVANREGDTATPTPSVERSTEESHQVDIWEDVLQDDLLNFAATPKGVLLLQQTGAMCECVSYMYSRYERKLQVSSCEKFGYGYMMSQIAATAPGIAAMDKTGFTCALIRALWNAVETLDDSASSIPKFWPVSPVDKVAKKPFINIVNLLSSFRSLFEVIGSHNVPSQKQEYSHRHGPTTVIDLLDRLTFIDTTAKIQSLFNYEYSHTFGLRLLSVLTSCLDTALLLQHKFKFQEMLLQSQAQNINSGTGRIILDMLSLERNYILVKTFLIGGPSERNLPLRTLQNGKHKFSYELFASYPVPNMYTVDQVVHSFSQDGGSDLAKFMSSVDMQQSWLDKTCKLLTLDLPRRSDDLSTNVCMQLMELAVDFRCQYSTESVFPIISSSESYSQLMRTDTSSLQLLGVSVAVRYGCYLKLLTDESEARENLCHLLKKCCHGLKLQQFSPTETELNCLCKDTEVGFDWFLATVFLMTSGNVDRTYNFLSHFSSLLSSAFVWTQRTHCSKLLPQSFVLSGILPMYSVSCHNIELILQLELPHVHSAFRMSGCSPAQICQQWLNQCFWNYLDWPQICLYMAICVVFGADYQVYTCVAILRHLQHELMQQMQDKNLLIFLKEEPIRHFMLRDHLDYMQQLQTKFRDTVLTDMHSILKEP